MTDREGCIRTEHAITIRRNARSHESRRWSEGNTRGLSGQVVREEVSVSTPRSHSRSGRGCAALARGRHRFLNARGNRTSTDALQRNVAVPVIEMVGFTVEGGDWIIHYMARGIK